MRESTFRAHAINRSKQSQPANIRKIPAAVWRICAQLSPASPYTPSYNRVVRIAAVLLLVMGLAACNRGAQNTEAVRQGVVDHLAKANMPVDVSVTSVQFQGDRADANVDITPKGNASPGMAMKFVYHLQKQGNRWVVVGSGDAAGSPHGGAAMPGATPNPHGGGMPAAGDSGGKMPAPEDLPPAGKKQ